MTFSRMIGTGSYLPKTRLSNNDLEKTLDTSDKWITERTGIRARRIAGDHENTSSMAHIAAQSALNAAQIDAEELDLIIVATSTPEHFFPSTACLIQNSLSIKRTIPAFDISAACAGFMYALSIADQFIRAQSARTVLVVGSEVMSRTVDWTDRSTCVLFGDGAGAVILQADKTPGIRSIHLHSEGKHHDLLQVPNHFKTRTHGPHYLQMVGNSVFRLAVSAMGSVVEDLMSQNNIDKNDIDWLIPHQANLRIIKMTAKKLALPMEQVILTLDEHGNTSSASIPLALDTGIRDGRIQHGQTLLLEGFGGGMVWGGALIDY